MSKRILVIDDERALLEDLVSILQYADYDAAGAVTGEDGLTIASADHPDLILCDIMMPGMDGFELLRRLRQDTTTSEIPFIFLTARGDRDSQRSGMELGADDYLVKPFSAAELLSAVESRLRRHDNLTQVMVQSRVEKTKQQIARMVTHELRTPLISINTVIALLTRQLHQLSYEEIEEMLLTINAGSMRLTHRVEQLSYISQLEAGLLSREVIAEKGVAISIWDVLTGAINAAKRFAYNAPEGVSVENDENSPQAQIYCNPPALKHALAEVISNGIKFCHPNGVVRISQGAARGRVWVSVSDQGDGIEPEQIETALRAFEQIDRERDEQQGIGIGLTLANAIIGCHDGELSIKSNIGHGTVVMINLPEYR